MLIDLGRNDAGRVAAIGSVRVTEKMVIERYSHVMHIVSNVEARIAPGLDAIDVFKASFPAGTVSGAPKVRAMEIIDELEPVRRGVYSGAVGYLGFNGDMDVAIAIRTAVLKDGQLHVQAAAGIVADSDPQSEWQETQHKARAILRAAEVAAAEHAGLASFHVLCFSLGAVVAVKIAADYPERVRSVACPGSSSRNWAASQSPRRFPPSSAFPLRRCAR